MSNLQTAALSIGLISGLLIIGNELKKKQFFNKAEEKVEQINMSRFVGNNNSIAIRSSILKLPVVEQPKTEVDNQEETKNDYVVIELQRLGQVVKKAAFVIVDTFNLKNNHEKTIEGVTKDNPHIGIPLQLRKKFETRTETNGKGELKDNFYHGDRTFNKLHIEKMVEKSKGQINKYRDLSNVDIRSERFPLIHPVQFKKLQVVF